MKGGSSDLADKAMTVNYITLQKYTLAINKYIFLFVFNYYFFICRELTIWQVSNIYLERRMTPQRRLKHSLSVCEVVNETVAA